MGLATLLIFPLLAWPILYFSDVPIFSIFELPFSTIFSIPTFLAAGIIFGLFVIWLSELPTFESALTEYKSMLRHLKITRWRALYLSLCAGIGEEIFFRGAIQPLLGIWITAIFFVGIHSYYSYKNWQKNTLGILLTFFIVLLGWGTENFTLWHAIAGHFSYDFVLLMYARKTDQ